MPAIRVDTVGFTGKLNALAGYQPTSASLNCINSNVTMAAAEDLTPAIDDDSIDPVQMLKH